MSVVLAIETSCDDTAAAVVVNGRQVLSSVVSSQTEIHSRFGGVVPEVAGRAHIEFMVPVVERAISQAGVSRGDIDLIGVTRGPGLIGSLLVGLSAAKAWSLAWNIPLVGVNHLEAHLHAAFIEDQNLALPAMVLLVSGGHTMLVEMDGSGLYRLVGRTIDDAAGEAFDKVARYMNWGYPGGPVIDRMASQGDAKSHRFPRGLDNEGFDFSFSGLKTSVINYVRNNPQTDHRDLAASFQEAVVDVLVRKTIAAALASGSRSVCLGGGVAANSSLRARLAEAAETAGLNCFLPSRELSTDNAAMVGAAAWYRFGLDGPSPLDIPAEPNLSLPWR